MHSAKKGVGKKKRCSGMAPSAALEPRGDTTIPEIPPTLWRFALSFLVELVKKCSPFK